MQPFSGSTVMLLPLPLVPSALGWLPFPPEAMCLGERDVGSCVSRCAQRGCRQPESFKDRLGKAQPWSFCLARCLRPRGNKKNDFEQGL